MTNTKKKILIVEDSESYLFILSETLRGEGFIVSTAKNGEEGLDAVKNDNPDLIILDITMPKMDGITMSKKLKEAGISAPIIFLTNMSDLEHINDAMENAEKYVDYIVKADTSVDDIVARIKEKLNH